ncbi:FAD-dependent oxidoreductase [Tersicoccus sp. Bi-70]|uniref:GcvT family protein n=1 Tax=Tersicoccus sp. Bi-70 TaxID=1897634 RepID=UPI0009784B34|nr:FAD-dependent oxidoreductase [Tersicoccus sp. Bi-70]OMH31500.1 sarcosine dehydrogenase [Tersicoccus sp. Bi-70]
MSPAGAPSRGKRVVIIGAGIVGANLADELAARGWTDVTVIDQGPLPLTGGSTSHAPGLVFQINTSRTMTKLATYTVEKLTGLDAFAAVGGLEVATTPERLAELHRKHGWGRSWGVDATLVDPIEAGRRFPLLDADRVLGALHIPSDGLASAVRAVDALIARAGARGVRFVGSTRVTGVDVRDGRVRGVRVIPAGGAPGAGAADRASGGVEDTVDADVVVSCAGFWGPQVGDLVGLSVPLLPMAHQYVTTTPLPDLAAVPRPAGVDAVLPMLRHQDRDLYYRQWGTTIGIGSYAHRPIPVDPAEIARTDPAAVTPDAMPSRLDFTPEDFEPSWKESVELLPALGAAGIADGFNGVFSFTPDGGSLVGESPQARGFWIAEAVWVTHSAGVARSVAQILVDEHPEVDLHELDLARFEAVQLDAAYVRETSSQNFVEVYDIIHPLQPRLSPRDLRLSPFHPRQVELGAVFLEAGGWERPHWYEANAALVDALPEDWTPRARDPWAARFHSPIAAAEAHATRTSLAMYDMTPLKRVEVAGPGACALLQHLTSGKIDKSVGAVTYCLALDVTGGIRSDLTVARIEDELFQVGANGGIDVDLLVKAAADAMAAGGPPVTVTDITDTTCCVGFWGPNARASLATLTDADLTNEGMRYFRGATIEIAGIRVRALRLSYVGELGWELYAATEDGLALWDALWEAGRPFGVVAAGRAAFNALRLEKGFRSWGTDMTTEHGPEAAGLAFALSPTTTADYVGRTAVADRADPLRLTCLTVDDGLSVPLGKEPVLVDGSPAGYVTSAAFGYTVGRPVAYAWLPDGLAVGDPVAIEYFGRAVPATVAAEPLVDPAGERVRG